MFLIELERVPVKLMHNGATDSVGLPLPQPKSDISDFGPLKVPNSGKPEFGERGERLSCLSSGLPWPTIS